MTIITINRTTAEPSYPTNSTRTTNKSFDHHTELSPTPPLNQAIHENAKTKTIQQTFQPIGPVVTNNRYQDALQSQQRLTNYSLSYAIQSYHEHNDFEQKENIQQLLGVDVFV